MKIRLMIIGVLVLSLSGCIFGVIRPKQKHESMDDVFLQGQQYFLAGNFKAAAGNFKKIIDAGPHPSKRPMMIYWLALCQANQGHTQSARTLLLGMEGNPYTDEFKDDVFIAIAETFYKENNFLLAQKYYERGLKAMSGKVSNNGRIGGDYVLRRLVECSLKRGENMDAELYWAKLKREFPGSPLLADNPLEKKETPGDESAAGTEIKPRVIENPGIEERVPSLGSSRGFRPEVMPREGDFFIQTGLFSKKVNAQRQVKSLTNAGYKTNFEERNLYGKNTFVVMVGPYMTYQDASRISVELRTKGFMGSFVKRK